MSSFAKGRFWILVGVASGLAWACSLAAQESWTHLYSMPAQNNRGFASQRIIAFSGGGAIGLASQGGDGVKPPQILWRTDPHGNLIWMRQYAKDATYTSMIDNGDGTFTVSSIYWDRYDRDHQNHPWNRIFTCDDAGCITGQSFLWGDVSAVRIARALNGEIYGVNPSRVKLVRLGPSGDSPIFAKSYTCGEMPDLLAEDVQATPDGGLILLCTGPPPYSTALIKVDEDGNVGWAKAFEANDPNWDGGTSARRISVMADGGFLLVEYTAGPALSYQPNWVLLQLDPTGSILWQEAVLFPDYPEMGPAHLLQASECLDGMILLSGQTGTNGGSGGFPSERPFLAKLNSSGEPLWARVYAPEAVSSDEYIVDSFPVEGGYVFGSTGWDQTHPAAFPSPSLTKTDLNGDFSDGCSAPALGVAVLPTTLGERDLVFVSQAIDLPLVGTGAPEPKTVAGVSDEVACGEAFPGICVVQKLQDPFRLKLLGWNFEEGALILIDGLTVPKTQYKGADKLGRTTLVAKGEGLKAMLPKGQGVCVAVVNPDGRQSVCTSFAR
jgi:hypothetical protein